tara:strand:+ start:2551 stop:3054 length:504 start_codon:yes stop_codon:yes gene_type:complete
MKSLRILLLFFVLPVMAFTSIHKYYISVTQIDYIKEKQTVQITTRIFIDDFENLLRQRYDKNITLAGKNESKNVNEYIESYLKDKLRIKISGQDTNLLFIGKDYDLDIMRCYLEIDNVKEISSIEVSNKVLFDVFEDQKNIIKTNINSKQKSFILTVQDNQLVLNFN